MAETDETIVSFVIFLFILLLFYLKFGKKILESEQYRKIRKAMAGKLGGKIKRPNISREGVAVFVLIAAVLIFLGVNYVWDSTHTTTYTLNSMESISQNWEIVSGKQYISVANGCMVVSGPVVLKLKNSEIMNATRVRVNPCDGSELKDITVCIGSLCFHYYNGKPPDSDYLEDKGDNTYYVGTITDTGKQLGTYLPTQKKLKGKDSAPYSFVAAKDRGLLFPPNCAINKVGIGSESLQLRSAYCNSAKGKGVIKIITAGDVKSVEVTEGLLP